MYNWRKDKKDKNLIEKVKIRNSREKGKKERMFEKEKNLAKEKG